MEFFVFVLILLAAVAIVPLVLKNNSNWAKSPKNEFVHFEGFAATQQVMGVDNLTGIAIDEQRGKLCLIAKGGAFGPDRDQTFSTAIAYGDILSVEVFEDIVPGDGFMKNRILRVELHIIVRNTFTPTHTLVFLGAATVSNSAAHKAAMNQARHWHGVLQAAIRSGEMHAAHGKTAETTAAVPVPSVADELRKLAQLRDEGVLTEPEFQQQKARLLV